LVTEKGTLLNEGAATLQYIADLAPGSGLAPAAGTDERYVLINNLNFLASELHASFGPLFGPGSDDAKAAQREKVGAKLKLAEELVAAGTIPSGAVPDVAGLYLYIIQSWSGYVGVSLEAFPLLRAFAEKVRAHPAVSAAHAAMNSAA
jgi:glutathione S-transferase